MNTLQDTYFSTNSNVAVPTLPPGVLQGLSVLGQAAALQASPHAVGPFRTIEGGAPAPASAVADDGADIDLLDPILVQVFVKALIEVFRQAGQLTTIKAKRIAREGRRIVIVDEKGRTFVYDTRDGLFLGPKGGIDGAVEVVGPQKGRCLLLFGK